jgi:hypothetical protein
VSHEVSISDKDMLKMPLRWNQVWNSSGKIDFKSIKRRESHLLTGHTVTSHNSLSLKQLSGTEDEVVVVVKCVTETKSDG